MDILSILVLLILVAVILIFYKNNQQLKQQIQQLQLTQNQQLSDLQQQHQQSLAQLRENFDEEKETAKQIALRSSRNAIKGQMSEKFCPFNADFAYRPADCSFLGKPIDFVVFHNIEHYREGEASIDDVEVIFLEIKTGNARLTAVEKAIQHAIAHKRVRFETYRFNEAIKAEDISSAETPSVKLLDTEENLALERIDFSQNDLNHRTETQNPVTLSNRKLFPRSSYRWSEWEQQLLLEKYQDDYSLDQLATLFERTPDGIRSRLLRLGFVIEPE